MEVDSPDLFQSGDETGSDSDEDESCSSEEDVDDLEGSEEEVEDNFESYDSNVPARNESGRVHETDEGRDHCPICLNSLFDQELGTPANCDHVFCFDCIHEWSKNINTCPIDRREFNTIDVQSGVGGRITRKVKVKMRPKEPEDAVEEVTTLCEICHRGDREDRLLLCDGCDLAYHCECLDPPLFYIPIEEWFCPPCSGIVQNRSFAGPSRSTSRRVIPRTRASEVVRSRVQNRRTRNGSSSRSVSTSSRTTTTPVKKRRRRVYRKAIKKVVQLARTKQSMSNAGKGKVGARGETVVITYRRFRRRRRRTATKTRVKKGAALSKSSASAQTRIAKRLGIAKPLEGSSLPQVKISSMGKGNRLGSGSSSKTSTHSLFGDKNQLMDFSENFNEDVPTAPSTSGYSKVAKRAPEPSPAAPLNILDSIMAGQTLLHSKSDNIVIKTDGSLILKNSGGSRDKTEQKLEALKSSRPSMKLALAKEGVKSLIVPREKSSSKHYAKKVQPTSLQPSSSNSNQGNSGAQPKNVVDSKLRKQLLEEKETTSASPFRNVTSPLPKWRMKKKLVPIASESLTDDDEINKLTQGLENIPSDWEAELCSSHQEVPSTSNKTNKEDGFVSAKSMLAFHHDSNSFKQSKKPLPLGSSSRKTSSNQSSASNTYNMKNIQIKKEVSSDEESFAATQKNNANSGNQLLGLENLNTKIKDEPKDEMSDSDTFDGFNVPESKACDDSSDSDNDEKDESQSLISSDIVSSSISSYKRAPEVPIKKEISSDEDCSQSIISSTNQLNFIDHSQFIEKSSKLRDSNKLRDNSSAHDSAKNISSSEKYPGMLAVPSDSNTCSKSGSKLEEDFLRFPDSQLDDDCSSIANSSDSNELPATQIGSAFPKSSKHALCQKSVENKMSKPEKGYAKKSLSIDLSKNKEDSLEQLLSLTDELLDLPDTQVFHGKSSDLQYSDELPSAQRDSDFVKLSKNSLVEKPNNSKKTKIITISSTKKSKSLESYALKRDCSKLQTNLGDECSDLPATQISNDERNDEQNSDSGDDLPSTQRDFDFVKPSKNSAVEKPNNNKKPKFITISSTKKSKSLESYAFKRDCSKLQTNLGDECSDLPATQISNDERNDDQNSDSGDDLSSTQRDFDFVKPSKNSVVEKPNNNKKTKFITISSTKKSKSLESHALKRDCSKLHSNLGDECSDLPPTQISNDERNDDQNSDSGDDLPSTQRDFDFFKPSKNLLAEEPVRKNKPKFITVSSTKKSKSSESHAFKINSSKRHANIMTDEYSDLPATQVFDGRLNDQDSDSGEELPSSQKDFDFVKPSKNPLAEEPVGKNKPKFITVSSTKKSKSSESHTPKRSSSQRHANITTDEYSDLPATQVCDDRLNDQDSDSGEELPSTQRNFGFVKPKTSLVEKPIYKNKPIFISVSSTKKSMSSESRAHKKGSSKLLANLTDECSDLPATQVFDSISDDQDSDEEVPPTQRSSSLIRPSKSFFEKPIDKSKSGIISLSGRKPLSCLKKRSSELCSSTTDDLPVTQVLDRPCNDNQSSDSEAELCSTQRNSELVVPSKSSLKKPKIISISKEKTVSLESSSGESCTSTADNSTDLQATQVLHSTCVENQYSDSDAEMPSTQKPPAMHKSVTGTSFIKPVYESKLKTKILTVSNKNSSATEVSLQNKSKNKHSFSQVDELCDLPATQVIDASCTDFIEPDSDAELQATQLHSAVANHPQSKTSPSKNNDCLFFKSTPIQVDVCSAKFSEELPYIPATQMLMEDHETDDDASPGLLLNTETVAPGNREGTTREAVSPPSLSEPPVDFSNILLSIKELVNSLSTSSSSIPEVKENHATPSSEEQEGSSSAGQAENSADSNSGNSANLVSSEPLADSETNGGAEKVSCNAENSEKSESVPGIDEDQEADLTLEALRELAKVPPPAPKRVVGVHKHLPQVITTKPVKQLVLRKPSNRKTFSFQQVARKESFEERANNKPNTKTPDHGLPELSKSSIELKSRSTQITGQVACNSSSSLSEKVVESNLLDSSLKSRRDSSSPSVFNPTSADKNVMANLSECKVPSVQERVSCPEKQGSGDEASCLEHLAEKTDERLLPIKICHLKKEKLPSDSSGPENTDRDTIKPNNVSRIAEGTACNLLSCNKTKNLPAEPEVAATNASNIQIKEEPSVDSEQSTAVCSENFREEVLSTDRDIKLEKDWVECNSSIYHTLRQSGDDDAEMMSKKDDASSVSERMSDICIKKEKVQNTSTVSNSEGMNDEDSYPGLVKIEPNLDESLPATQVLNFDRLVDDLIPSTQIVSHCPEISSHKESLDPTPSKTLSTEKNLSDDEISIVEVKKHPKVKAVIVLDDDELDDTLSERIPAFELEKNRVSLQNKLRCEENIKKLHVHQKNMKEKTSLTVSNPKQSANNLVDLHEEFKSLHDSNHKHKHKCSKHKILREENSKPLDAPNSKEKHLSPDHNHCSKEVSRHEEAGKLDLSPLSNAKTKYLKTNSEHEDSGDEFAISKSRHKDSKDKHSQSRSKHKVSEDESSKLKSGSKDSRNRSSKSGKEGSEKEYCRSQIKHLDSADTFSGLKSKNNDSEDRHSKSKSKHKGFTKNCSKSISEIEEPQTEHPKSGLKCRKSEDEHSKSRSECRDSVDEHSRSRSKHRDSLNDIPRSKSSCKASIDEHPRSKSKCRDSMDEHLRSRSKCRDTVKEHSRSKSKCRDPVEEHPRSKSKCRNSLDEHPRSRSRARDSVDDHSRSKSKCRDSIDEHPRSRSKVRDNMKEHPRSKSKCRDSIDEHPRSKSKCRDSIDEHSRSRSQSRNSIDEYPRSISKHRYSVDEHPRSKSKCRDTVNSYPRSRSKCRDSIDEHTRSKSKSRESVKEHTRSRSKCRDSIDEHARSKSKSRESVKEHTRSRSKCRDSIDEHKRSKSKSRESVKEHTRSRSKCRGSIDEHTRSKSKCRESVKEHTRSRSKCRDSIGEYQRSKSKCRDSVDENTRSRSKCKDIVKEHTRSKSKCRDSVDEHPRSRSKCRDSIDEHARSKSKCRGSIDERPRSKSKCRDFKDEHPRSRSKCRDSINKHHRSRSKNKDTVKAHARSRSKCSVTETMKNEALVDHSKLSDLDDLESVSTSSGEFFTLSQCISKLSSHVEGFKSKSGCNFLKEKSTKSKNVEKYSFGSDEISENNSVPCKKVKRNFESLNQAKNIAEGCKPPKVPNLLSLAVHQSLPLPSPIELDRSLHSSIEKETENIGENENVPRLYLKPSPVKRKFDQSEISLRKKRLKSEDSTESVSYSGKSFPRDSISIKEAPQSVSDFDSNDAFLGDSPKISSTSDVINTKIVRKQELKEEIANEVKMILKPFYSTGLITKDDYKEIMRKAVPKIFLNCHNCINPDKIKRLVHSYVALLNKSS